ncbi:hypothetical protein D3C71_1997080 [compost metagenome]
MVTGSREAIINESERGISFFPIPRESPPRSRMFTRSLPSHLGGSSSALVLVRDGILLKMESSGDLLMLSAKEYKEYT